MRYIEFGITDSAFEISRGGSVYDSSVGSDSFSEPGWIVETNGYAKRECELSGIEDEVQEYLNLGGRISVQDESGLDMDEIESSSPEEDDDEPY